MKKTYIFLPVVLAAGAFLWMSASGGVAKIQNKDRTGSPVTDPQCTMCHIAGANYSTVASFSLSGPSGIVSEYVPGETYTLTVDIQSNGNAALGFQTVALFGDNTKAGDGSAVTSGTQISTLNGREYFEHLPGLSGGVYEMDWVAPSVGSGDVTFYGSALSVDNSSSTTGDEFADIPDLKISEGQPNSVTESISVQEIKVYPNPTQNELTLDLGNEVISKIEVYSITGVLTLVEESYESKHIMNVSGLEKGSYVVRVFSETGVITKGFVKK